MKTKINLRSLSKLAIPALCFLLVFSNTNAQNLFPMSGRTGIYTTSPAATLQVKGGARIGTLTNYLNIDSLTGNLSFTGTATYRVANNQYAFQNSANPGIGLYFNATNARYEFRNTSSSPTFYVGANTGNGVFIGNLKVGAYTLPATDGANGQVLKTNGTGTLTWSNDNTSGGGSGWLLTGNSGTNPVTNFIGTTDAQSLIFKVNNQRAGLIDYSTCCSGTRNTAFGQIALNSVGLGADNTAMGYGSLYNNTSGNQNSAYGKYALYNNNADNNSAYGFNAMFFNTTGTNNTATGSLALQNNTTSSNNTANGYQALYSNNVGSENTAIGAYSLLLNTSGAKNTATGYSALNVNSTGNYNTAVGNSSLNANSTGSSNTATGYLSLFSNQTGSDNAAFGQSSLEDNVQGFQNTALGNNALRNIYDGWDNTAVGFNAIHGNTNGTGYFSHSTAIGSHALYNATGGQTGSGAWDNTAVGYSSLYSNTYGRNNTAIGVESLRNNNIGVNNSAIGLDALFFNTIGSNNTAIGISALFSNTQGNDNTAEGAAALRNNTTGFYNTAIGEDALYSNTNGAYNTGVGLLADVNSGGYNYSTAVGVGATITASNQIRIGSVGSASGYDPVSIGGVVGWSTLSDGRVKKNIKQNVPGLAFINKLQAVTYNLDLPAADKIMQHLLMKDKNGKIIQPSSEQNEAVKAKGNIVYTGFVAQDVEKAAKSLNYDFSGVDAAKNDKDLYGLRYAEFVVPLVKAVQELSAKNDDLQKQINELKSVLITGNNSNTSSQITSVNISSAFLEQNIPNPFANNTIINYTLPKKFTTAQIIITDKSAKTIKAVNVSGSGKGSLNVDAAMLASGAYQYSLLVDGKLIATKQMVLAK